MGKKCAKCGSENLVKETGFTVCGDCGVVVEETDIVIDEPMFSKESDGTSSIVGQFVPASGVLRTASRGPGGSSFASVVSGSYCSESREATIENGRRRIVQLAGALRAPQHAVDAAHRFFMLAVQHDFVKGRKVQYVAAACLYVVCRREKTSRLLHLSSTPPCCSHCFHERKNSRRLTWWWWWWEGNRHAGGLC